MQLCLLDASMLCQTLDFIAGYPAIEGKLTYEPNELTDSGARWIGRIRCVGYAISHAVSIPISPLVAAIRVVVMPIFLGILVLKLESKDRSEGFRFCFIAWLKECSSIITSPLLNIAGTARASLGVIEPKLYLRALYVTKLSEGQREQMAYFLHQYHSPSRR